jgi:hypothetical protein
VEVHRALSAPRGAKEEAIERVRKAGIELAERRGVAVAKAANEASVIAIMRRAHDPENLRIAQV